MSTETPVPTPDDTPETPASLSGTTSFPGGSFNSGSVPPAPEDEPVPPAVVDEPVVEPTSEVEPEPESEKPDTSDLSHDDRVVLATLPTAQTATDTQGTERIVVPDLNASGWRPAPLEPDPEEVARLERRQAAIVAQDEDRAKALGL